MRTRRAQTLGGAQPLETVKTVLPEVLLRLCERKVPPGEMPIKASRNPGEGLANYHPNTRVGAGIGHGTELRADFTVSAHRLIEESEGVGSAAEGAGTVTLQSEPLGDSAARQADVADIHRLPGAGSAVLGENTTSTQ